MNREQLKALRKTDLGVTKDGDFVFVKHNKRRTKVYGPVSFKEAMIICWAVMNDYKEEIENEQADHQRTPGA